MLKLISWNVNGIRACLKKGFLDFLKQEDPDIICLQETRGYPEDANDIFAAYDHFWNHAEKKGYSGTAIFVKKELGLKTKVQCDIGKAEHDNEGRVIYMETDNWFLVNVYTPNSGSELKRLEYRGEWDREFLNFIKDLEKKKPVIACGDFNVAHKEIDLARPDSNHSSPGFTDEEREGFSNIVANNFVDTFREFNKDPDNYSWWSYRGGARQRNVGWRIDYFIVSEGLKPHLRDASIYSQVLGSDHCPVGITFKA